MRLPFQIPFGKKQKIEYFLSLVIRDDKVSAVIFEESLGKVRIVTEQEEYFTGPVESASLEELLEVFDSALSQAENKLDKSLKKPKTIFGVKENWILQSRIKKEYLVKLKKISDTLDLEPIGFIVIPEAIAHLLSQEEGAPVSAILVEIGKKQLSISLIRAGKIIEIKEAPIETSIAHTTDKVLHHFTDYEILPSRVLLFDGDKDNLVQEFMGHTWSKSLPFLHVPQVQALNRRFDARAVLFGAATQMGFELLHEESKGNENKKSEMEEKEAIKKISSDTFGFFKEVDVAFKPLLEKTQIEEKAEKITEYSKNEVHAEDNYKIEENLKKNENKILIVKKVLSLVSSFIVSVPIRNIGKLIGKLFFQKKRKIFFVPPLVIAFVLILFVIYIFNVKSTVTLRLNPKVIQEDQNISFSNTDHSDFSRNIIASETISVLEEGTATTQATGKKEVGDKAKGTVTIYSSLPNSQTFSKGTTITSSNDLKFTLDNDAKVSSSSGVSDVKTTQVSAAAGDIGKEYNLPSGTKFAVNSFDTSNVEVKNDNAFSGGSKKEITVVSKKDKETLIAKIPTDLSVKAKDEIMQKIPNDKLLLPIELQSKIDKTEFDQDIGDEAKSVTLKARVSYEGYLYRKSDFEKLSETLLKNKFPSMTLAKNGISSSFNDVKSSEETIDAVVHLKAMLIPEINSQTIAKQITGVSFEEAKAILSKLSQVSSVNIALHPNFPFAPKILPRFTNNIIIVTTIND